MNIKQFLLILRAHYFVALFALLGTVAMTLAVSLKLPEQYTARASVFIDVKSPDPIAGMLPALTMPGYVATQVDIIKSDRVALNVVKMLKLDESASAREQWIQATEKRGDMRVWLAQVLQAKLDVKPSRESSVIKIEYQSVEPEFAAVVANAFVQSYIKTNIELKVEPARQYTDWFDDQGKALRVDLEKAQARLSKYQQRVGIVVTDERLDNEMAKLNEISTQLTMAHAQTTDAQSKQRSGSASDTLPEVVQNPLIRDLRADIARLEAKLQELSGNFGKNHPQYQRMESEIATLKQKLEAETRHVTSGFATSSSVGKDREAALRRALEEQKRKLLQLRQERDEVAVLRRDVEAAQRAYETVSQRFNQTRLESQSTQTNVSMLTAASVPVHRSSPNIRLNVLLAVCVGTILGLGAALVLEMLDRRVRSAQDLSEMIELPVLGVIGHRKSRSRLVPWRRDVRALPAA